MPNAVLVGLVVFTFMLPFLMVAAYSAITAHRKAQMQPEALWPKLVFPLLYVLTICAFAAVSAIAASRWQVNELLFGFWFFAAIMYLFCMFGFDTSEYEDK